MNIISRVTVYIKAIFPFSSLCYVVYCVFSSYISIFLCEYISVYVIFLNISLIYHRISVHTNKTCTYIVNIRIVQNRCMFFICKIIFVQFKILFFEICCPYIPYQLYNNLPQYNKVQYGILRSIRFGKLIMVI